MPRMKKDGQHLNLYLDRELMERFRIYCEEKGQTMTTALERILKKRLDDYDSEKQNQ